MKHFIVFLIIIFLMDTVYPFLFFVQATSNFPEKSVNTAKQDTQNSPEAPGTFKEAKTLGNKFLTGLPEALKKTWQEGLSVWKNAFRYFKKNIWDPYIGSWAQKIWNKVESFWKKEIEKRKPEIKKEFQKEKKEMREEIPNIGKSFWQRFMELVH